MCERNACKLCAASHSLRSSPSGSATASRRFPHASVGAVYCGVSDCASAAPAAPAAVCRPDIPARALFLFCTTSQGVVRCPRVVRRSQVQGGRDGLERDVLARAAPWGGSPRERHAARAVGAAPVRSITPQ